MKIAIVDDDMQMYDRIHAYLNELLENTFELTYFESGEQFLNVWKPNAFDLIILDIFMDGLTGMNVAREIRKTDSNVKIVFSTTSNEYASESYEVNACYYLHKPFGSDRVKAMLDRLNLDEIEEMRSVTLPDGTNVVLHSIIYADFSSHRVSLHCKHNKNVVVRLNFSEIEPLLCAYPYFFSPTKGVVINFYEVTARNDDTFKMSDGSIIPISRRKTKEVLDSYYSFLFEQLRKGGKR